MTAMAWSGQGTAYLALWRDALEEAADEMIKQWWRGLTIYGI